jgi:hypothetical protein
MAKNEKDGRSPAISFWVESCGVEPSASAVHRCTPKRCSELDVEVKDGG